MENGRMYVELLSPDFLATSVKVQLLEDWTLHSHETALHSIH